MNKSTCKLSIIVPTYNEQLNIGRTLKYIKNSDPLGELIVVDGGSSDNTVQIAKKHADKVVQKKTHTIAEARNIGARAASGDILLFVDADTTPHLEFFEKICNVFHRDKRVVGAGCVIMPRGLNFFEHLFFYFLNFIVHASVVLRKPAIAGSCVAYRKKQFFQIGGFDQTMAASEDQDFSMRIAKLGHVIFFQRVVAYTSPRRLRVLGFVGLLMDWGKTTINFLLGIKTKSYQLAHKVK